MQSSKDGKPFKPERKHTTNIKTTISLEEKEQMITGVRILSGSDGVKISRDALKIIIENVLCWLDIKDEEEDE